MAGRRFDVADCPASLRGKVDWEPTSPNSKVRLFSCQGKLQSDAEEMGKRHFAFRRECRIGIVSHVQQPNIAWCNMLPPKDNEEEQPRFTGGFNGRPLRIHSKQKGRPRNPGGNRRRKRLMPDS